jgi:hypothetical protein
MVGSTKVFDEKYKGKYTMTLWDVTMTNRYEGKADVFWWEYEAVRGGRGCTGYRVQGTGYRVECSCEGYWGVKG